MTPAYLGLGLALLLAAPPAPAPALSDPDTARRLDVSARFIDTTIAMSATERPEVITKPTAADLKKAAPSIASQDFSLSFNCAVRPDGRTDDCRGLFGFPDGADKMAIARALGPYFRLSRASAALARDKAYRVTFDVALNTLGPSGFPKKCLPPMCVIEFASPPRPPAPIQNPVMAAALQRANDCFDAALARSTALDRLAYRALRLRTGAELPAADRQHLLDFVASRRTLKQCVATLEATAEKLPLDGPDFKTVRSAVAGMKRTIDGQARAERILLIGAIDPATALAEERFP